MLKLKYLIIYGFTFFNRFVIIETFDISHIVYLIYYMYACWTKMSKTQQCLKVTLWINVRNV